MNREKFYGEWNSSRLLWLAGSIATRDMIYALKYFVLVSCMMKTFVRGEEIQIVVFSLAHLSQ